MILAYTMLCGLGAYRLWRILAEDSITTRFRDWLYDLGDSNKPMGKPWTLDVGQCNPVAEFFADLVSCPWCLGFWYAGALAWLVSDSEGYNPTQFALVWLGASAICGLTHHVQARLAA